MYLLEQIYGDYNITSGKLLIYNGAYMSVK
jgi:hypothetical protein